MPADLSSYLATHYLTADPKPSSKKRKRKHGAAAASSSGLLITDDDDSGWAYGGGAKDGDDDDDRPAAVAGTSAEFRRKTKSNWKTLGGGSSSSRPDDSSAAAAADAILAEAAAENAAAQAADDDGPVVEDEDMSGTGATTQRMTDGTHAGLQSAAAVTAQLKRRAREEREQFERERRAAGLAGEEQEQETIYRDATGRRIDVSMRRAEARRAAAEAEEKERLSKEALKGEVQIEEARRRREALEDAALMPLARRADDEEMNQELKEQDRWNDPMAQFLGGNERGAGSGSKSAKSGKSRRPVYKGAAPPNRYGIRPGYRWDGVDRGNGFEGERFKAINRRERNKDLSYSWQMDE